MMFTPRTLRSTTCLTAALLCVLPAALSANPVGGTVTAGQATINSVGNTLNIHQQSNKLLIDWRGFDIDAGEQTEFFQPGSNSIAVNRVNSTSASQIHGTLKANGNVVIINQNGVLFGAGARVDVNGLVATTADLDNDHFMNNDTLVFDKAGNPNASIINEGTITAKDAGLVGFVAPNVVNSGTIRANLGRVHLASGDTATVDMYGDGLMKVAVSDAVKSQFVGNSGTIEANGGTVALTAAAGKNIVNSLIVAKGTLKAQSVGMKNGKIVIAAEGSNAVAGNVAADKGKKQGSSTVIVQGVLDASGRNAGERGGDISVLGDNIALLDGTMIDASGHTGLIGTTTGKLISDARIGAAGGDIKIGGDYLGGGNTATAKNLFVGEGVLVLNDSLHSGDAGRTIFWSDDTTQFYGNVYARALGGQAIDGLTWNATAGGNAGDGGFIETSGKKHLDAGGYVDLTASNGEKGTYFLDPTDITIYGNFDPTDVSSGRLWLDASQITGVSNGQSVSVWDDLFGTNDATAFATGPTYITNALNGNSILRFSNSNGMRTPSMSFADWSIFMIFRDTSNQTSYERLLDHDYINGFWFGRNASSANSFGGGVKESGAPYGRFVTVADGQWNLIGNQRSGTTHSIWANGNFSGGSSGTVNGTATTTNQLGIGMWHNNGTPGQQASNIDIAEIIIYSDDVSSTNRNLIEQYQSAKWGIALTPPGTGANEVAKATASDGYSGFTTRYLERLSQSANISLQATNNITLDLQGDTLNFTTAGRSLTLTAGNQITTASAGNIITNGGDLNFSATNGILFNHAIGLNSNGGNITFNNAITSSAAQNWNAGTGNMTFNSTYTGTGNNLTLSAGQMDINNTINVGTNTLTLKPTTAKAIRVGRSTDNGDDATYFDISAPELARIQAGTLSIGDASLASPTTLAGNLDLTGLSGAAGVYNLAFNTAGTFDSSGYTVNLGRDAISLDGNNDYLHVTNGYSNLFSGDNTTSLSFWFNARNVGNNPVLFDAEDGAYSDLFYELSSANGFYWAQGGTFRTYSPAYSLNQWNHVVFVKTGATTGDLYLNGSILGSYTGNFSSSATSFGDLLIGKFKSGGYNFNGMMDDIRIYNTNISGTDVAALYNGGAGGAFLANEAGLRAAYGFSEGTGTTAVDASGNTASATLVNGPTWVRAQNLSVNAGGAVTLGNIWGDGSDISVTGNSVTVAGKVAAMGDGTLNIAATNNITLNSGASVNAGGTGNSLVLNSSAGNLINNAGASAVSAANGRWLVYTQNASGNVLGGLSAPQTIYGQTYGSLAPGSITGPTYNGTQNSFIYASGGGILRFTANNLSRIYGNLNPLFTYSFWCSTGCTEADAVTGTPTLISAALQGSNVGSYGIGITQGSLALTGLYSGYTFDFVDGTLTIDPRTIAAGLTGTISKIYNRSTLAALTSGNYTLSNIYNNDDVVLNNPTSGTYDDWNVGTGKNVTVTGLSLSGTKASNYVLASTSINGSIGEIIAKALTISGLTANHKIYNRSTLATLSGTGSLNGIESGDSVTLGGTYAANFADWNVGTGKAVTVTGYTLGGADFGNYTLTQPTGLTADITAKALSISANALSKIYGAADPTLTYTSNGLISGDSISGSLARAGGQNVGTYAITQGSLDAGSNYTISYTGADLTINPASLTVNATNLSMLFGATEPALTYSYTGLVNGDVSANFTGALARTSGSTPGTYSILQNTLAATGNYTIGSYNGGTLTINPASQQSVGIPTSVQILSQIPVITVAGITNTGTIGASSTNSSNDRKKKGEADHLEEVSTQYDRKNNYMLTIDPKLVKQLSLN